MRYQAIITKEGEAMLAEFPDCPGCQTFAEPGQDIEREAAEALEGWLESVLARGGEVPRPSRRQKGAGVLWFDVPSVLAVRIQLRWARLAANLTQAELGERAGVSQQAIAKLEHPDSNPTIETLEKVARALHSRLTMAIVADRER